MQRTATTTLSTNSQFFQSQCLQKRMLPGGEISRDLVADVSIAAVFDSKASNKAHPAAHRLLRLFAYWLFWLFLTPTGLQQVRILKSARGNNMHWLSPSRVACYTVVACCGHHSGLKDSQLMPIDCLRWLRLSRTRAFPSLRRTNGLHSHSLQDNMFLYI